MNNAGIRLIAIVLAFTVVAIWSLRTDLANSPLLAIPGSTNDSPSSTAASSLDESDHKVDSFRVGADEPAVIEHSNSQQVSQKRREHVRQLIRGLRPQESAAAIEVWVDEFEHTSDDEIIFLMNQSGRLGSIIVSPLSSSMVTSKTGLAPLPSDEAGSRDLQIHSVRTNLDNIMTVGYRERLDITVISAVPSSDSQRISMRRLTCGNVFMTGDPLHVALRTAGLVFFQLADGRLTRNGMFVRTNDGRLGLKAGDGFVAIQDSPIFPADVQCSIAGDGRILDRGSSRSFGEIRVVTADRADELSTNDGVYFTTSSEVRPAENFELQSEAFELSNVDVKHNQQILESLNHCR
ncbi:MAG: hypothetical protein MK102_08470 [Fuerstiella sp.]|nr:hypothetical protein [Fuerstiella sp.]